MRIVKVLLVLIDYKRRSSPFEKKTSCTQIPQNIHVLKRCNFSFTAITRMSRTVLDSFCNSHNSMFLMTIPDRNCIFKSLNSG